MPTTMAKPPRLRITIRQLIGTIIALAIVNALGAGLSRPLADEGPRVRADGLHYFGSQETQETRARLDRYRVEVLRIVTVIVIVGNGFVLSVLGFWVGIAYLEELRRYQLEREHATDPPANPPSPSPPSA